MSLVDTLNETKENLESLVTYSNEITGQSDTDISGCIASLVSGFGSGGSGLEKMHEGEFTLNEPFNSSNNTSIHVSNFPLLNMNDINNQIYCITIKSEFTCENGFSKWVCFFTSYNDSENSNFTPSPVSLAGRYINDDKTLYSMTVGFTIGRNSSTNGKLVIYARFATTTQKLTEFEAGTYKYEIYKLKL